MNQQPRGSSPSTDRAPIPQPPASQPDADEIDYISFDRRKRAESIRQNEQAEREKRQRQIAAHRRAERIRRAKIARIKALCLLVVMGIGLLCLVIGLITALVKAFSRPSVPKEEVPDNAVSAEESALIQAFADSPSIFFYEGENAFLSNAGGFIADATLSGSAALNIPQSSVKISEFDALARRLGPFSTSDAFAAFKTAVKNAPMFSNGYVWSETESIKSTLTGGYLYDTNPSYISAIAGICLWESDSSFLSEVDSDAQPKLDASQGKTVLQKLEEATDYLFDGKIEDGGAKYDPISGLVYIHTPANNGTSSGLGSNLWFNFRFGYLDAYTNVAFQRAMQQLQALYTFLGLPEKADAYAAIALKHAAAFNEKFWDAKKQRYIGCIDINGKAHDYGFVFFNLEVVDAGLADADKASAIFAWLDGERLIDGDTTTGADIYSYSFAPRSTTLAAEDTWWDYSGGTLPLSAAGAYGTYYQNGGTALSTAYYDIRARRANGQDDAVRTRLTALINAYADGTLAASDSAACRISGDASSGLAPVAVLDTVFGLSTDGIRLSLTPDVSLPADAAGSAAVPGAFGVRGIGFGKNTYGFLFDGDTVYITAVSQKPVRIRLGGLEAGAAYELITVQSGLETGRLPLTANAAGELDIAAEFGSTSYIKIVRASESVS